MSTPEWILIIFLVGILCFFLGRLIGVYCIIRQDTYNDAIGGTYNDEEDLDD